MEGMDDFGDLYADVEVHVNAGVGNFDELYSTEEEKNDRCLDTSEKKETEADSVCRDDSVNEEVERLVGSDAELPGSEADNENLTTGNGSDSEDDLHIVLNEEDCRMFPTSRVRSSLNRGYGAGSDDEDDDLVIVTEIAGLNNANFSADGLDESNGNIAERGNALKAGYLSQYSQFKYVRHHAAVFPSTVRTSESGGTIPISSTLSGRGDWDVKRAGQQNAFGMTFITQNGFGFSLPRNRTIFDVGIETFEWKPWRHPGVDITDYFNYGLEEESWKNYCKSMDNLCQQATMQTEIPVHDSSRPSQAYEAEFLQKTAAPEIQLDEINLVGLSERISSVAESVDFTARSSEIPRGRAILVEGGTGERMPSMDVRRPRHRDSDVVIQIAVQDCVEDSSKDEIKRDKILPDPLKTVAFEDNPSMEQPTDCFDGCDRNSEPKVECASSYLDDDHHRDRVTNLEQQFSNKAEEPIPEENCKAVEASCGSKEGGSGCTTRSDKDANSSSDSGMLQSLSPLKVRRNSGQPKVGIPSLVETDHHMTRQTSSSVTGQQEPSMSESDHSDDSRSVTSITDEEKRKNYKKRHPIRGEHNHCSGARLCSVAESKNHLNDGSGSPKASQKGSKHRAHLWCEMREKKQHNYDTHEEEDLTHYRRTKKYVGFHGGGSTGKLTEQNAYTELFHRNYDLHSGERMRSFIRRSQDEWKYVHERGENEITDRKLYCRDRRASSIDCKDSKLSPSRKTFYPREEGYMLHERRGGNVHFRGKRAGGNLFELEYRYREGFVEEKSGRDEPYYGREEPFQEKYRRKIPCYGREEELIHDWSIRRVSHFRRELPEKQERYGHGLHFDADHSPSSVYGNRHWRHPDDRPWLPQTIREIHTDDGREWWDDGSRHHIYGPGRSYRRHGDHWGPNSILELHSKKTRGDDFMSVSDEYHYPSHDNDCYFGRSDDDSSGCHVYHKDIVCNKRKRYSWQSKATDRSDFQASIGYQDQDSSYNLIARDQCKRNSKDRHGHLDHSFVSDGRKPSVKYYLDQKKKNATEEASGYAEVRKQMNAVSYIDGTKVEATITNCRESVDLHLNDREGKRPRRSSSNGDTRYDRHGPANPFAGKESVLFRNPSDSHTGKEIPSSSPKTNVHPCSISSKIERLGPCISDPLTDQSNEKWLDKYPIVQDQEGQILEEGQLVPEEPESEEAGAGQRKRHSEKIATTSAAQMKKPCSENAANDDKAVGKYDNGRILETLAKMEKRRERFKDPITPKKEPDKSTKLLTEPVVETVEIQAQRPARKRRWGGS